MSNEQDPARAMLKKIAPQSEDQYDANLVLADFQLKFSIKYAALVKIMADINSEILEEMEKDQPNYDWCEHKHRLLDHFKAQVTVYEEIEMYFKDRQ